MQTLLILALLTVAILALVAWVASRPRGAQYTPLANVAEGFQPAIKTYLADAAIATRYLLVKIGSDANHVALAGAADIPIGIASDEPSAAEENVAVLLLGVLSECAIGVASGAIAAGAMIVSDANGKVRTLTGLGAGTYYIIGRAIKATAADGDPVEFVPCFPIQRVVP